MDDTNRKVFPTHVGVYLIISEFADVSVRFPHTRGGVPERERWWIGWRAFSPHTWGCTGYGGSNLHIGNRFPHTRGGVPIAVPPHKHPISFSPHTWGCTPPVKPNKFWYCVFPTHVGVYREGQGNLHLQPGFPHTRGGVPRTPATMKADLSFPHTRGGVPDKKR